jgi:hypothetical protein
VRTRCASAHGAHTHALPGGRSTGTLGIMSALFSNFLGLCWINVPQAFAAAAAIHVSYSGGRTAILRAIGIAGFALFAASALMAMSSLSTSLALLLATMLIAPYYAVVALVCLCGYRGGLRQRTLEFSCVVVSLVLVPLNLALVISTCGLFGGRDCTL